MITLSTDDLILGRLCPYLLGVKSIFRPVEDDYWELLHQVVRRMLLARMNKGSPNVSGKNEYVRLIGETTHSRNKNMHIKAYGLIREIAGLINQDIMITPVSFNLNRDEAFGGRYIISGEADALYSDRKLKGSVGIIQLVPRTSVWYNALKTKVIAAGIMNLTKKDPVVISISLPPLKGKAEKIMIQRLGFDRANLERFGMEICSSPFISSPNILACPKCTNGPNCKWRNSKQFRVGKRR